VEFGDPAAERTGKTVMEEASLEEIKVDGGYLDFPVQAERCRRAGQPEEAERIARMGLARTPERFAGRVALGLALLDRGLIDEARTTLAGIFDGTIGVESEASPAAPVVPYGSVCETQSTALAADAFEFGPEQPLTHSPFATETVADLLEKQGAARDAQELREQIAARQFHHAPEGANTAADERSERVRVIATLERWLHNLRGGAV